MPASALSGATSPRHLALPIDGSQLVGGVATELDCDYAYRTYKQRVMDLITANDYRTVCEVGGGRKPLLTPAEVEALGLQYTILDISQAELDRAPGPYRTICADICQVDAERAGHFDLVFSVYLMEHVVDGRAMHRNIYAMLTPGSRAFHYFPTLYSPAFVLNRLMPNRLTDLAKRVVHPADYVAKFPARYSWCFGPTPKIRQRFGELGYQVESYEPFYGTHYFTKLPVIGRIDARLTRWAARRRNPYLTSYAFLVLRKPWPAGTP